MLRARESFQEDVRTDSFREITLPLAAGHSMPPAASTGQDWNVQLERANYPYRANRGGHQRLNPPTHYPRLDRVKGRMLSSEGIVASPVYQRATER